MKQLTRPMLRRLAWLDDQLHRDRYPNSRKMRDVFEVSDRTFYRDIACLRHGRPD